MLHQQLIVIKLVITLDYIIGVIVTRLYEESGSSQLTLELDSTEPEQQ